jgi:hypothetical protein
MRELNRDELQTCESLVKNIPSARLTVLPTHHIDEYGSLAGFHWLSDSGVSAAVLPLCRRMFFGHTCVVCNMDEEDIYRLILQQEQNQRKMTDFMAQIQDEEQSALLNCSPEKNSFMNLFNSKDVLTKDSRPWTPDVPDVIGIYHAMVRGYSREIREHKLYMICSGGLTKACDEFCNLVIDVGRKCDAYTVAISDEAWWLRRACRRARCNLIYKLAKTFNINVQCVEDIQANERSMLAVHTLDTVEHDIIFNEKRKQVSVLNACVDTSRYMDGALVKMHPVEGFWFFRSDKNKNNLNQINAFPVTQPIIHNSNYSMPVYTQSRRVTRFLRESGKNIEHYMCFDERYLSVLQQTYWDRNNGITEMIPITVATTF